MPIQLMMSLILPPPPTPLQPKIVFPVSIRLVFLIFSRYAHVKVGFFYYEGIFIIELEYHVWENNGTYKFSTPFLYELVQGTS